MRSCFLARLAGLAVIAGLLPTAVQGGTLDIPELFEPRTATLENGMRVVVLEDHRAPVLTHMVWYGVGAADEPPGKSGIAHFLEHLMFKGTDKLEPGEFSRIVAQNGGRDNAFTSKDYTAYFQSVAADKLETVMSMEADRMVNLKLSDDVVAPERSVVLEERSQRTDNDPQNVFGEQLAAAQFLNHPYGIPIIGWRQEIENLGTEDALTFYRNYYAPNNAILVVAGDTRAEQVFELAERHFGPIPSSGVSPGPRPKEPPQLAARRLVMEDERVRQPSWQRSYLAPTMTAGESSHAIPLQVLAEIVGGNATSRLYRELVVPGKASYAAAWYDPDARDETRFVVYASPVVGGDVGALETAIDEVLSEVVENGVTEDELTRAKTLLMAEAVYARDSLGRGARIFGGALAAGQSIDDIVSWPNRVNAVTLADVQDAARAVLDQRRSVTGVLLPKSARAETKPNGKES